MKLQLLTTAATGFILSSSPSGGTAQIVDDVNNTAVPELINENNDTISSATPAAFDASSNTIVSPTFQFTPSTQAARPTSRYTTEQCNSWVTAALAADTSNSGGLTGDEYLTFLQSISNPPYVGEYFKSFTKFTELTYTTKFVNKIITCACTSLPGYDPKTCCIGPDAELPLVGFNSTNLAPEQKTYRAYFCETLGILVSTVTTGEPTASPSLRPISDAPVSEAPIMAAPVLATLSPTSRSSTSSSLTPSPSKPPVIIPPNVKPEGLTDRAIAGIVVAIFLATVAAIFFIVYLRYKEKQEQQRLRQFAEGENAPDDLVPEEDVKQQEEQEEEDDVSSSDSSSEPSVWSESDDNDDSMVEEEEEQKVTESSAVAAMGIASTVVTQITSKNGSSGSNSS